MSNLSYSEQNTGLALKTKVSSISSIIPFIGHTKPSNIPFIGNKQPFDRIRPKQSGFTLIELLIALVIVGVLSAIAAPSMRAMNLNNRMVTETNDLLVDFLFMRSEAIKLSKNIHMCKSTNPNAAQPVCDSTVANPWTSGWIIWSDNNASGALNYTATSPDVVDTLLRVGDGFSGSNTSIDTVTDGGGGELANEIIITRLGILGNTKSGHFNICDSRGVASAKRIDVNISGRARINRKDAASC